jgi:hypothetical protein
MPPALFALVILEIGGCFLPRPAWTMLLLFYASYHSWDDRCTPLPRTTVASHWLRWSLANICLFWPWTMVLLISASQLARIMAWATNAQIEWSFFFFLLMKNCWSASMQNSSINCFWRQKT